MVLRGEVAGAEGILATVCDRGPGLAREDRDRVFPPFYTTKRNGLGMGLSITRSIIDAHGGRLWAENNLDRGAVVCFTLPISRANDDRVAAVSEPLAEY